MSNNTNVIQMKQIMIFLQPLDREVPLGEKRYFNVYINADIKNDDLREADDLVERSGVIQRIMDYNSWSINADWQVISVADSKRVKDDFKVSDSPEAIKKKTELVKFSKSMDKKYALTAKDIEFDEKTGSLKILNLPEEISIPVNKLYEIIEKKHLGDTELKSSSGKTIVQIKLGSFLNAALGDIQVFDKGKEKENSLFNQTSKGGIFIRENGTLDFGDMQRTIYMTINIAELLKELNRQKMLFGNQKGIEQFTQKLLQ